MWIVDWEYSGMNDPMWDLGDLSVEAGFSDAQDEEMIAAYFGGRTDAFIMRAVDMQLSFPAILVALVLLVTLGMIPLGIPLIWIVPWVSLAYALLYFKLFGAEGATLAD